MFDHPNESSLLNGKQSRQAEPSSVRIRRAVAADALAIASVLYRSFLEYESSYTLEAFAVTTSTPERILDRIDEGPIWVALKKGAIIGTVSAVVKDEGLYIRGMAVDPTMRGSGIGRKLLERVEEFAVEQGCKRLFLSTTPFLKCAIRLYEQFGFGRTPEGPDNLSGTPLFTMVKNLARS